jgi:hypothetical protein
MRRIIDYYFLFAILLTSISCSEHHAVVDNDSDNLPIHYVAIDIDDIFQPNWDSAAGKIGNVKMDADDVKDLVQFSRDINAMFGFKFKFTIGYNSAYYDSTWSGDQAFIEYRDEFCWFNHLPKHEHVRESNLSAEKIDSLFDIGNNFANIHHITLSDYMVTPLHDGIWPPYDPLYAAFQKNHILYTSTENIACRASYGDVDILPRHFIGIGSSIYSVGQVDSSRLEKYSVNDFNIIRKEPAVILYSHQSNYARDHLGEVLIRMILLKLKEQNEFHVVFLPAEELEKIVFKESFTVFKLP